MAHVLPFTVVRCKSCRVRMTEWFRVVEDRDPPTLTCVACGGNAEDAEPRIRLSPTRPALVLRQREWPRDRTGQPLTKRLLYHKLMKRGVRWLVEDALHLEPVGMVIPIVVPLYIGGQWARHPALLAQHDIRYVLAVQTPDEHASLRSLPSDVTEETVYVADDDRAETIAAFHRQLPFALAWLKDALATGEHVLVHCTQGVSRSAAIAVAYMTHMLEYPSRDPTDALALLRRSWPRANPRPAFLTQH